MSLPRKSKKERGTRTGFTTGACIAAAARAATLGLTTGHVPEEVECLLANGKREIFLIEAGQTDGHLAHAHVVKDSGDDPDVTNRAHLTVDVKRLAGSLGHIQLLGGKGVGLVTMPGLGLKVGGPAINPVPQRNIRENVREVGGPLLAENGIEITISIPGGERLAERTLNARLGIVGGLSILGTSGIVHPWSTAAFRSSVIQAIEVAGRQGHDTIVLTTGGRTETFVKAELPSLLPAAFVQMGDFIKAAFDTIVSQGIRHVVIGGMVGKLAKMAQGETMTHARKNPVNTALVAEIAASVGAGPELCTEIREGRTARLALERMTELNLHQPFILALARRVIDTLLTRYPDKFSLTVLACDFDGRKLAELHHA